MTVAHANLMWNSLIPPVFWRNAIGIDNPRGDENPTNLLKPFAAINTCIFWVGGISEIANNNVIGIIENF